MQTRVNLKVNDPIIWCSKIAKWVDPVMVTNSPVTKRQGSEFLDSCC